MRHHLWIAAPLALALLLVVPALEGARAQDAVPDEDGDSNVAHLLGRLVRETRKVREQIASGQQGGGASELESHVREIRDALKPGEVAVVRLPAGGGEGALAPASVQETQLNEWARKGFRLVSVSQGFAYFQK